MATILRSLASISLGAIAGSLSAINALPAFNRASPPFTKPPNGVKAEAVFTMSMTLGELGASGMGALLAKLSCFMKPKAAIIPCESFFKPVISKMCFSPELMVDATLLITLPLSVMWHPPSVQG